MDMFCFQCQETFKNTGCTKRGVCGKSAVVANLQDFLIWTSKGLSEIVVKSGKENKEAVDRVVLNLFTTITNANFDTDAIMKVVKETIKMKDELLEKIENKEGLSDFALYSSMDDSELERKAVEVGVLNIVNEDERSLTELTTYGLKGMAAYNHHANVLGYRDVEVDRFIAKALEETTKADKEVPNLIDLVMATGEHGVKAMALLDKANTTSYGHQKSQK